MSDGRSNRSSMGCSSSSGDSCAGAEVAMVIDSNGH
jgi:hypothetical protein